MNKKILAIVILFVVLLPAAAVIIQRSVFENSYIKYLNKGIHEKGEGHYIHAEKSIKKALKMKPDSAEAHFYLGSVYLGTKKADKAIRELNKAISLDDSQGEYYAVLSFAYFNLLDDKEEGAALMDKALKLEPRNYQFHVTRGVYLEKMGSDKQAIDHYETALKLEPSLNGVRMKLIALYEREGEAEKSNRLKNELEKFESAGKKGDFVDSGEKLY